MTTLEDILPPTGSCVICGGETAAYNGQGSHECFGCFTSRMLDEAFQLECLEQDADWYSRRER